MRFPLVPSNIKCFVIWSHLFDFKKNTTVDVVVAWSMASVTSISNNLSLVKFTNLMKSEISGQVLQITSSLRTKCQPLEWQSSKSNQATTARSSANQENSLTLSVLLDPKGLPCRVSWVPQPFFPCFPHCLCPATQPRPARHVSSPAT